MNHRTTSFSYRRKRRWPRSGKTTRTLFSVPLALFCSQAFMHTLLAPRRPTCLQRICASLRSSHPAASLTESSGTKGESKRRLRTELQHLNFAYIYLASVTERLQRNFRKSCARLPRILTTSCRNLSLALLETYLLTRLEIVSCGAS